MDTNRRALIELARRRIGTLRSELKYRSSHQVPVASASDNEKTMELDRVYWRLHKSISNARYVLLQLSTFLEAEGDDPEKCEEIADLQNILMEAAKEKEHIDGAIFSSQKKKSLGAFKQSIAEVIERGDGPRWITTVQKEDIVNHGGEVNRLYQLLSEGKQASSLAVDSVFLRSASTRTDLFSKKQCESLAALGSDAQRLELEETERLVAAILLQDEQEMTGTTQCPPYRPHLLPGITLVKLCNDSALETGTEGIALYTGPVGDGSADMHLVRLLDQEREVTLHFSDFSILRDNQDSSEIYAKAAKGGETSFVEILKKRTEHVPSKKSTTTPQQPFLLVTLRNTNANSLLGRSNKSVTTLKETSGADFVSVLTAHADNRKGVCPVLIEGKPEATRRAAAILKQKYSEMKEIFSSNDVRLTIGNGGVEKQGDGVYSMQLWLPSSSIPEFIGPRGRHAQQLKKDSGVLFIHANQKNKEIVGRCPVIVKAATIDALQEARFLVLNKFLDSVRDPSEDVMREDSRASRPAIPASLVESSSRIVTVYVLDVEIPALIGTKGKHVKIIEATSGVEWVMACQDEVDKYGKCPVRIKGSEGATAEAIKIIGAKFAILSEDSKAVPGLRQGDITLMRQGIWKAVVWVWDEDVPKLIGPCGQDVAALKKRTGACTIYAEQQFLNSLGMCPVKVEGTKDSVKAVEKYLCSEFGSNVSLDSVQPDEQKATVAQAASLVPVSSSQAFARDTESLRETVALATGTEIGPDDNAATLEHAALTKNQNTAVRDNCTHHAETSSFETSAVATMSTPPARASTTNENVQMAESKGNITPSNDVVMTELLNENKTCLSCSPSEFLDWLHSVHIYDLTDFAEALTDDEFVQNDFKTNGLKLFKRYKLRDAVVARAAQVTKSRETPTANTNETFSTSASLPHPMPTNAAQAASKGEALTCPISLELMTRDPVVAGDGFTYERHEIESWFAKQQRINGNGEVRSPVTSEVLANLSLVPNLTVRTMAREQQQQAKHGTGS